METTRHFVSTVYVVHDGKVALHDHKKLPYWLPPGGHIDPKELPHESALRECEEETGLDVELVGENSIIPSETVSDDPQPQHIAIEDISVVDGEVYHKHVNHIYFAETNTTDINPQGEDEVSADDWSWFTKRELVEKRGSPRFLDDVIEMGKEAIERVE